MFRIFALAFILSPFPLNRANYPRPSDAWRYASQHRPVNAALLVPAEYQLDYKARVWEQWTDTDATVIHLTGTPVTSPPGIYHTFAARCIDQAEYAVLILHLTQQEYEVAHYVYNAAAGRLNLLWVEGSSNNNLGVTFSAGDKYVGIVDSDWFHNQTALLYGRLGGQLFTGGRVATDRLKLRSNPYTATLTWPLSDGAAGQVLTTDAAGNLSWSTPSAGGVTDHGALTGLGDDDHPQYGLVALPLSQFAATTSTQLRATLTDPTGTGANVFADSPTIITPTIASFANATHTHQNAAGGGQLDHGLAITGLGDDDHTQYALLAGRAGGQTFKGGTGNADTMILSSTNHATKGKITVGTVLTVDEASGFVGINKSSPAYILDLATTNTATAAATTFAANFAMTCNPGGASSVVAYAFSASNTYTSSQVSPSAWVYGFSGYAANTGTGTVANCIGANLACDMNNASGTITSARGGTCTTQAYAGTMTTGSGLVCGIYAQGGTITTGYAGYFDAQRVGGTFTTAYGGYFNASGATTNHGVYVAGGRVTLAGSGVVVGAPTGGDLGAGTINVATSISKNNTAYTNPDYVFEHFFTGKIEKYADREGAQFYAGLQPLEQVEDFARQHLHLPNIPDIPTGIFERADLVLELVESLYLYAFDAHKRIQKLESCHGHLSN